jgi:hypothetical protein
MYGAAVGGGRGALLGWENVPSGASSAFGGGSSYSAGSFYGAELPSSENEDIPQPPRPQPPPPPPILSQLSSVFFTAALVDFDGRDLAGDPQQFEEFRDLYLDAIGRIPQLLNLQTYQVKKPYFFFQFLRPRDIGLAYSRILELLFRALPDMAPAYVAPLAGHRHTPGDAAGWRRAQYRHGDAI